MEYPKLLPGDCVIPGKHRSINGDTYWSYIMDQFVGKETQVKELNCEWTSPPYYSPTYLLNNTLGSWRICDIEILLNKRNINHPYIWAKRLNKPLPEGMY